MYPVRLGFALGAYPWLGADALWLSFPVSSLANVAMAIGLLSARWLDARRGCSRSPSVDEAIEEAEGLTEPGGADQPGGLGSSLGAATSIAPRATSTITGVLRRELAVDTDLLARFRVESHSLASPFGDGLVAVPEA